jgi:hypothetical protein
MSSDSGSKENTFEDVADRTPEIPDEPSPNSSKSSNSSDSNSNSSDSNSSDSDSSDSDSDTSAEAPANVDSPEKVDIVENTTMKTKKPVGQTEAAIKLREERRSIFDGDLKEAYILAFGDDKKAPKPKFLEATALLKIRREQGESAYKKKIQEYVERDRVREKPAGRARTAKAKPMTVVKSHSPSRSSSSHHLVKSIHEMAHSMRKHLSDIESAAVQLAKEHPHTPSPTKKARKPRSNIGKTHKKKGSAVKLDS